MDRLPYLECYPNGRNGPRAAECVERNIGSYPTWLIGGQYYTELMSPQRLAQLSNFAAPALEQKPAQ